MKLNKCKTENKSDLLLKLLNNKNPYEIGKFFEKEAMNYLKEKGFENISWVSRKKPTSHFDITAKKNSKLFYIEVRYTKSKKFQITERKITELKKLDNVLFLLISPKRKMLIPLEDIEKEKIVSINKGFISNLEIKKRKIKGNKKSLLNQFINSPKIKIFDFLLDNKPLDFSKEEIARGTRLSKTSVHKIWNELEAYKIIKVTRQFGKTKLYTLNSKSIITKRILDLEKALISEALENEELLRQQHEHLKQLKNQKKELLVKT